MTNLEVIQKLEIELTNVKKSIADLDPASIAYLINVDDRLTRAYEIIKRQKELQTLGLNNPYEKSLAEQLFNNDTIFC